MKRDWVVVPVLVAIGIAIEAVVPHVVWIAGIFMSTIVGMWLFARRHRSDNE